MSTLETIWKCQIAWGQISFLLGVLGNIFTLYATTAHNAIKLDKMSIWIIKNLAVADICNCFLVILPILLHQYHRNITQQKMFDETFHEIFACYRYIFFMANIFLVNILSLNKLLRCLFPLRNLVTTKRQKITVTMTTVIVSTLPAIWIIYGIKNNVLSVKVRNDYFGAHFFGNTYSLDTTDYWHEILMFCVIGILNALPCVTMVMTNTTLIGVAVVKARSTINKTNILMIVLVTVGFLVSILPHYVVLIVDHTASIHSRLEIPLKEIVWSLTFLSTWINPFIYLAVNPTFRDFTIKKLSRRSSVVGETRN